MDNEELIEKLEKRDMTQYVGSIQLSDKVMVSDPCYDCSTWTWSQCVLEDVLTGNYRCFIKMVKTEWDDRIGEIIIYHENYDNYPNNFICNDIGVDSGQAGFFDYAYFKEVKSQDKEKREKWYQEICKLTIKTELNPEYKTVEELVKELFPDKKDFELIVDEIEELFNILKKQEEKIPYTIENWAGNCKDNKCVVSSTGFGDGCYDLYIHKNNKGKIVSMRINFI